MKPSKKKTIKILSKKLIEKIHDEEKKVDAYRMELIKLIQGDLEIEIHDYKGKSWYLGAKTSDDTTLPYTLVYDFIDR